MEMSQELSIQMTSSQYFSHMMRGRRYPGDQGTEAGYREPCREMNEGNQPIRTRNLQAVYRTNRCQEDEGIRLTGYEDLRPVSRDGSLELTSFRKYQRAGPPWDDSRSKDVQ